jgi:hypothetical protein
MVVGATGAIGSACARLLVRAAEEVYLVSPETAKLLALKASILRETPDAKVFLSARADKDLAEMDMIVTATSGAGKKVLDIMKVKPGCVITDVARPLDLPPEEVARRPDVLVVESGEIQLPGEVHMKNIGLPKGVAYACLAETIVLALEGRFENFTVGRNIEWEKVREIYQLGLKHGMKLAAISGAVNGRQRPAQPAAARRRPRPETVSATRTSDIGRVRVPASWRQGRGWGYAGAAEAVRPGGSLPCGARSRGPSQTRYVRCAHCAQTIATSQMTKRAGARGHEPCAPRRLRCAPTAPPPAALRNRVGVRARTPLLVPRGRRVPAGAISATRSAGPGSRASARPASRVPWSMARLASSSAASCAADQVHRTPACRSGACSSRSGSCPAHSTMVSHSISCRPCAARRRSRRQARGVMRS